jgi:hypothetical protein
MPGTNTLAYSAPLNVTKKIKFYSFDTWLHGVRYFLPATQPTATPANGATRSRSPFRSPLTSLAAAGCGSAAAIATATAATEALQILLLKMAS